MWWVWVIVGILVVNLLFFLIRFYVRNLPHSNERYKFKKGSGVLKDSDLPNTYTLYKKKYGRSIADPDFDPDINPDDE